MYELSVNDFVRNLLVGKRLMTEPDEFCSIVLTDIVDSVNLTKLNSAFKVAIKAKKFCDAKILNVTFSQDILREPKLTAITRFVGILGAQKTSGIKFLEIKNDNFSFEQTQWIYNIGKACGISVSINVVKHFIDDISSKGFHFPPKTALIGVQHGLETTANLIEGCITLGIAPNNIFLVDKDYSTARMGEAKLRKLGITLFSSGHYDFSQQASGRYIPFAEIIRLREKELLDKLLQRINDFDLLLVLVDGAGLIKLILDVLPDIQRTKANLKIVSVEQTTRGMCIATGLNVPFPLVSVASSYAKKAFESSASIATSIVAAIEKKILKIPDFPGKAQMTLGIVGYGNIGKPLLALLRQQGWKDYIVCDTSSTVQHDLPPGAFFNELNREFVGRADFIIGCVGSDITGKIVALSEPAGPSGRKIFVASASSEDVEVQSVLDKQFFRMQVINSKPGRISDLYCPACPVFFGHDLVLLKSGYPINFGEYSEYEYTLIPEIYLTRLLLLGAIIQASIIGDDPEEKKNTCHLYTLHPYIQNYLIGKFLQYGGIITHSYEEKLSFFSSFAQDKSYIEEQSSFQRGDVKTMPCDFKPPQTLDELEAFRFKIEDIRRYFSTYGFSEGQMREIMHRGVRVGEEALVAGMMAMFNP
jgi:hypothetical protein